MNRKQKVYLVGGLIAIFALAHFSCEIYLIPYTQLHNVILKFFYIPIVMAAFWWGIRGGATVGIISAAIYGIYLLCWPVAADIRLLNPISEILLLTGIGTLLGWMVDHDRVCRIKRYEAEERAENEYHRAITDPLTQAYNRRYMDLVLEEFWGKAQKEGPSFSLLMIDLNSFKSINDHYGHPAGDHVLKAAVQTLLGQARQSDRVFRYGGDEFLLLLPETTKEEAVALARRLREEFAKLTFRAQDHTAFTADFSIGVIEYQPIFKTQQEMFAKLDESLYLAKKGGIE